MTRGVSIETWIQNGSIQRELLIYKKLLDENFFKQVVIHTNGDQAKQQNLILNLGYENIKIRSFDKRRTAPPISTSDIVMCNQTLGGIKAMLFARKYSLPFIARSGFSLSSFLFKQKKYLKYVFALLYEFVLFTFARKVIVSSISDIPIFFKHSEKFHLIENYVNSDVFKQETPFQERENSIVFVGRFEEQKNLLNTLKALIAKKNVFAKIYLVGTGSLAEVVKSDIRWLKNFEQIDYIQSENLAALMSKCKYHILCSYYEGTPKVLLEAQTAGCISIVSPMDAIEPLKIHCPNLVVASDFSASSIVGALESLDEACADYKVVENSYYSIDNYVIKFKKCIKLLQ